ncbi:ARM repeat superfamily protein, partial [Prunus dulcis]
QIKTRTALDLPIKARLSAWFFTKSLSLAATNCLMAVNEDWRPSMQILTISIRSSGEMIKSGGNNLTLKGWPLTLELCFHQLQRGQPEDHQQRGSKFWVS